MFRLLVNKIHQRMAGSGIALAIVGTLCAVGCRGPAQRDVYAKRMANEVRVLEDQLYDADYQNRVLRDELDRVKASCEPAPSAEAEPSNSVPMHIHSSGIVGGSTSDNYGPIVTEEPIYADSTNNPIPPPIYNPQMESTPHSEHYGPTPAELPAAPTIVDEPSPRTNSNKQPTPAAPLVDPEDAGGDDSSNDDQPDFSELPAPREEIPRGRATPEPPMEPEPPGPNNLPGDEVKPGILPPSYLEDAGIPGRVNVPELDALRYTPPHPEYTNVAAPDHIQLHPSLSGGHQFDRDEEADGLYIVVNVVDEKGHALNLSNFDIDADMTIVALDPSLDASASRIGRWEFDSAEVKKLVRSIPVHGLHVPIEWQDMEPVGDEVIVHVRLKSNAEEMRCEGKIKLNDTAVIAKWMPRAGTTNR